MTSFFKNYQKYLIAFLAICVSILISFPITIIPHKITLACVLGIILIVVVIKWPNLLIALIILLDLIGTGNQGFGSINFSLNLFGFNIYYTDIILILVLFLALIYMLSGKWEWPHHRIMIPILIFMGVAVIDIVRGYFTGNSIRNVARDFGNLLPYAVSFFIYNIVRDRRTLIRWVWILIVLSAVTAAISLIMRILGIQTTFGFEGFATSDTALGEVNRAYGLSGAIPFYMFGFFMGIAIMFTNARKLFLFKFINLLVATIISLGALLLLFIRSYYLGLLAGIAIMIWLFKGLQRWSVIISGVIIFMLIFVIGPYLDIPITAMLANRFISTFIPSAAGSMAEMNAQVRFIEMQTVLSSLKSIELVFGNGLGSVLAVTLPLGNIVTNYHNSIAALVLKMGIFGGLIWIGFPLMLVHKASGLKNKNGDQFAKTIFLGLTSFIIAWAVGSSSAAGMPMIVTLTESVVIGLMLRSYDISRIEPVTQE